MTSPPSRSQSALKVVVRRGDDVAWTGHFVAADVSIGRSPACDVVLDDSLVSWTHARVTIKRPGGITFTDQSANGSFRNGQRIGEVTVGRGGVIGIPPFEIDLSIEMISKDHAAAAAIDRSQARSATTESSPRGPATPLAPLPDASSRTELRLVQAPGALLGSLFPVADKTLTIGRAEDCDVRLDLPSISRRHATLTPAAGARWTVHDNGSRNGVEVNGVVVTSAEVQPGDRLGFGPEVVAMLQVIRKEEPVPRPAPATTGDTVTDGLAVSSAVAADHPKVKVLRVVGRVDGYGYAYLREEVTRVIDAGTRLLVVDLSRCSYCDHAGLGVLVNAEVALGQRRGGLRLIGLSRQLHDAFLLLRLDQVLAIAADEAAAAADLERLVR